MFLGQLLVGAGLQVDQLEAHRAEVGGAVVQRHLGQDGGGDHLVVLQAGLAEHVAAGQVALILDRVGTEGAAH